MGNPLTISALGLWLSIAGAQAVDNVLPRTEVEAERDSRSEISVPGDGTSIRAEQIHASAVPSVAELLRIEAGLSTPSFFGNAGSGVPVIRGFAENASSRTLILVDGLPVNRPDLSAPAWFEFPLAGLEKIEVSRGSRTVRYGSAALAGVISLETNRDLEARQFHFESSFGSDGTEGLRASLGLPLTEGWQFDASFDRQISDGWRDHSGYAAESFQFSLSSPRDERFYQRWLISHSDYEFENPGGLSRSRYEDDPRQSIYEVFGVEADYVNRSRSTRLANQMTWQVDETLNFQQSLSWMHRQRNLNFGAGSHTDHEIDTFNYEGLLTWKKGDFELQAGLRGQFDDFQLSRFTNASRNTKFAGADLTRSNIGLFAIGSWQASDDWRFTAGASWDTFQLTAESFDRNSPNDPNFNLDDRTDDQGFGFEASAEFTPSGDWTLWMRYDRVYRFPVMDEVAGYQGFVLSTPFNADLQAETGHALELGSQWQRGDWSLDATLFAQALDDEIIYDFAANQNVNFASTRRYGIETALRYQSGSWLGQIRYGLTRAEFADGEFAGKRLPLVAEHSLTASLQWQPVEALTLRLEADYLSSSPEGNDFGGTREFLPDRWLVNSLVRWQLTPEANVFIRVNNLFDQRYAALKYSGQWYPGAGRQFIAGLQLDF